MGSECIKLIPFTDDELMEVHVTIVDRMLELNRDMKNGKLPHETAVVEMETLSRVSDKVSKYSNRR